MKYSEFRDVVKKLINGHYKMKASESEMIDFESKLIDYVADSNYKIYVRVPCRDWTEDVKMTSQDLLRFVRKPRAVVKIEKLLLYNEANETFSNIYYDVREPDEFGNYPECPEIPKEFPISSKMFRIRKKDLPDLLEEIKDDDPFELKGMERSLTQQPQKEPKNKYIFRKDGERWYIKFENEVLKPENLDGFGFIHYLMQYDKKITSKKLYQAVKGIKTSNKDEGESFKTYSVESKTIEKAQLGELKERYSNSEMLQCENELIKMNKNKIKKIVEILKKDKEALINKKSELEENGRFSESDDIEKEIKDVQEKIDLTTRQEHNPEHKQFYDLVYKANEKAKEKIKALSAKEGYDSLLTWNHFEDLNLFSDSHYFYNPTDPIDWEL